MTTTIHQVPEDQDDLVLELWYSLEVVGFSPLDSWVTSAAIVRLLDDWAHLWPIIVNGVEPSHREIKEIYELLEQKGPSPLTAGPLIGFLHCYFSSIRSDQRIYICEERRFKALCAHLEAVLPFMPVKVSDFLVRLQKSLRRPEADMRKWSPSTLSPQDLERQYTTLHQHYSDTGER